MIYKQLYIFKGEFLWCNGNVLNRELEASEFERQSSYCIPFRIIIFWKGMNSQRPSVID